jgi:hypothetical protein
MGTPVLMRFLDLLVRFGARGPWARERLAFLVLQSIVVADRAPTRHASRRQPS